ncbi:MAG: 2Fe-2S iron-sulfur cluster-binding protein [Sphingomonas sp.]
MGTRGSAHGGRAGHDRGDEPPCSAPFADEQAAQCGYCIAGMIMRAQALLDAVSQPSEAQIRSHMQTNLCRCGTHMRILRAIRRAAGLPRDGQPLDGETGMSVVLDRRQLLAGGGLLVAFTFATRSFGQQAGGGEGGAGPVVVRPDLPGDLKTTPELDAWIRIAPDGQATVFSGKGRAGGRASAPR